MTDHLGFPHAHWREKRLDHDRPNEHRNRSPAPRPNSPEHKLILPERARNNRRPKEADLVAKLDRSGGGRSGAPVGPNSRHLARTRAATLPTAAVFPTADLSQTGSLAPA